MNTIQRLPSRADGTAGLLRFADAYGDAYTFRLIRLCRTAQNRADDTAGAVMRAFAVRMVTAYEQTENTDHDTARRAIADQLGYDTADGRGNFYDLLKAGLEETDTQLADNAQPLTNLAETYGDAQTYQLILMCRTAQDRDTDYAGAALVTLAQRMVDKHMREMNVPYDTARRAVSDSLGYSKPAEGNGRSNFYQLLRGGRQPERRPRGGFRK